MLSDGAFCLIQLSAQPGCTTAELLLEQFVSACAENAAEDLLAFFGISGEKLLKVALGDHGDLTELTPIQSQNLLNSGGNFLGLGNHRTVGKRQGGIGRDLADALAPDLLTDLVGFAGDGIGLPCIGKGQGHKGVQILPGIHGAQHTGLPEAAAGLSKQGEGDGIKKGGLTGPGVSGDQIQTAFSQTVEVQGDLLRVRTEGGHGQL